MVSNKFSIHISVRVVLIVLNCYFLVVEYTKQEYIISVINLALLLVLQTFFLIRFIHKKNQQVSEYFDLIKNKDTASRLSSDSNSSSFSKIRKQVNDTNQIIQDLQIEKEIQSNFFNHLVNDINIGLFAFDERGRIQFINPEAKRILGMTKIFKIEDLQEVNTNFVALLQNILPGQQEIVELKNSSQKLSLNCGLLNLGAQKIKLISFHDIDKHLYQNEIESWNKLIRIMNHEIMNSITPITSLSKTMKKYFFDGENEKHSESILPASIGRTIEGLNIIEERGNGLIHFVNNYRKLSSLPQPNKADIQIQNLLIQSKELFREELESKNIEFVIDVNPDNLIINADKEQISQILVNLIKNSLHAMPNNRKGRIVITASKNDDKTIISVQDNGTGIPKEIMDDIFIPFYTSKESGSGIGLSLSKQIMKLHDGTISVSSIPDKITKFMLSFKD